jgi:hypothetical protein
MSGIPKDLPMGSQGGFISPQAVAEEEQRNRDEGRAALARESMREVQMFSGRGGRPETPERYQARMPVVPLDLETKASELADRVYQHGVAIDTGAILAKSKQLFTRLLELDCAERQLLGFVDLTRFAEVENELRRHGALQPPSALVRSPREQVRGLAGEKAAALRIESFADLWRFNHRLVRNVMEFHSIFGPLVYARSLLARADEASRIRSRFFVSGLQSSRTIKVLAKDFDFWRDSFITEQNLSFIVVSLQRPLESLLAWLTGDSALATATHDKKFYEELAREFFDSRAIDVEQEETMCALVAAFCYGRDFNPHEYRYHEAEPLSALETWRSIGDRLGRSVDLWQVAQWRRRLASQFPHLRTWFENFVPESMQRSYTQSEWGGESSLPAQQFSHDLFTGRVRETIDSRLVSLRKLVALTVSGALGENSKIVAVLPNRVIIESPVRGVIREQLMKKLEREITSTLASAFEPDAFSFTISTQETL